MVPLDAHEALGLHLPVAGQAGGGDGLSRRGGRRLRVDPARAGRFDSPILAFQDNRYITRVEKV